MPVVWWLLAAVFALSVLLAVGLYLGPGLGVGATAASLAVAAGLFVRSAVRIEVDDAAIRVGRALIEHRYIAGAQALDAEQTRRRAGVEADARAHLVLRPYVSTRSRSPSTTRPTRCRTGWSPPGVRTSWPPPSTALAATRSAE